MRPKMRKESAMQQPLLNYVTINKGVRPVLKECRNGKTGR
jgi:hypothetical protein